MEPYGWAELSETVVRDVHTETTLGPRGMGGRDPCFTL